MLKPAGGRAALLLIVATAISGASRAQSNTPPSVQPPAATASPVTASAPPLDMRLGWVTRSCLATANGSLTPGSPIAVVSMDDKATIVGGRVGGRTASDAKCPAQMPDRRAVNESRWSFYEVQLSAPVDLGIAVLGEAKAVNGGLDLNEDGAPETFTRCASSEGVWFRVWSGPAYQGRPLWSAYYYLGYDTEVTCPS
jgi:hypothetical protein